MRLFKWFIVTCCMISDLYVFYMPFAFMNVDSDVDEASRLLDQGVKETLWIMNWVVSGTFADHDPDPDLRCPLFLPRNVSVGALKGGALAGAKAEAYLDLVHLLSNLIVVGLLTEKIIRLESKIIFQIPPGHLVDVLYLTAEILTALKNVGWELC
ncbi:hypothetical protein FRX31_011956 [Thalictrum thalictroides]|uniref:Uncharacterized protein n=1 Tax=Thalictrum thalictroides TaxID=46969 RepID=A0A7J6WM66_THATH|nr:hypothetical protein FRX31_011956 [Thalictrum thalictroides]